MGDDIVSHGSQIAAAQTAQEVLRYADDLSESCPGATPRPWDATVSTRSNGRPCSVSGSRAAALGSQIAEA